MHEYPWIKRFIRYGKPLAAAVLAAGPLLAVWGVLAFGLPWPILVLGIAGGLVGAFFILVFAELTHVIAEMLLPR